MKNNVPWPVLLLVVSVLLACKPAAVALPAAQDGGTAAPAASAAPRTDNLRSRAEASIVTAMTPAVAEFVRAQPWYEEVTQAEYAMLETLRDTDRASVRHGSERTFLDSLRLTTEQWWFHDGFDDNEAKALTALYRAYQAALADRYGLDMDLDLLASSIRGNFFHVLTLPESGEVTIVLAADKDHLAAPALQLAVESMPRVEEIIGKYPYPFVYIWVTDLGDGGLLGLNRNEFIAIGETAVERNTVAHELAHATLYGSFPLWFEEGLAYYIGSFASDELKEQTLDSLAVLALARRPRALDLRAKFDHSDAGYFATISQGFLFFQGIVDIQGLDGLSQVVRALRSKTYTNDNELLRAIVANSKPEHQAAIQQYLCRSVIGLRSGCE